MFHKRQAKNSPSRFMKKVQGTLSILLVLLYDQMRQGCILGKLRNLSKQMVNKNDVHCKLLNYQVDQWVLILPPRISDCTGVCQFLFKNYRSCLLFIHYCLGSGQTSLGAGLEWRCKAPPSLHQPGSSPQASDSTLLASCARDMAKLPFSRAPEKIRKDCFGSYKMHFEFCISS